MSEQPNTPRGGLMYVPGEAILAITHPANRSAQDVVSQARDNMVQNNAVNVTITTDDASRAVQLPAPNQERGMGEPLVNTIVRASLTLPRDGSDDTLAQIIALNTLASRDVNLQVTAVPNWFIGGAPYLPIGGGGPGTPPEPRPAAASLNDIKWTLPPALQALDPDGIAATPVNVFIFDTVPPVARFQQLVNDATHPLHSLLVTLNQQLTIFEAPAFNTDLPPALPENGDCDNPFYRLNLPLPLRDPESIYCTQLDKEDYSDHGIFIAMIVHQLAPNAKIYLLETLNDACVGSMLNLTEGLAKMRELLAQNSEYPSVVNMSLLFCTPVEAIADVFAPSHEPEMVKLPNAEINPDAALAATFNKLVEVSLSSLGLASELYQDLTNASIHFLAASGNEGGLKARYPASAGGVIGIGAVGQKPASGTAQRAAYSNIPDITPMEALWAWGGGDGSDPQILGICTKYPNGVGTWKGTSFATGVASGVMARALGLGKDEAFVRTQCKIADLDSSPVLDAFQG